jgi:hypothetical protein
MKNNEMHNDNDTIYCERDPLVVLSIEDYENLKKHSFLKKEEKDAIKTAPASWVFAHGFIACEDKVKRDPYIDWFLTDFEEKNEYTDYVQSTLDEMRFRMDNYHSALMDANAELRRSETPNFCEKFFWFGVSLAVGAVIAFLIYTSLF